MKGRRLLAKVKRSLLLRSKANNNNNNSQPPLTQIRVAVTWHPKKATTAP
jgi:hypothetical protein